MKSQIIWGFHGRRFGGYKHNYVIICDFTDKKPLSVICIVKFALLIRVKFALLGGSPEIFLRSAVPVCIYTTR